MRLNFPDIDATNVKPVLLPNKHFKSIIDDTQKTLIYGHMPANIPIATAPSSRKITCAITFDELMKSLRKFSFAR